MTISPIFKDTLFFAPTELTGTNTNTSALKVAVQNQAACGVNFGATNFKRDQRKRNVPVLR